MSTPTRDPLAPLTTQEFFDITVRHLFKQGRAAVRPRTPEETNADCAEADENICMYRAPNGDKCAVGVHITDDQYDPKMEGLGASALQQKYNLPQFRTTDTLVFSGMGLARSLQNVHDNVPAYLWERELRTVAERCQLNPAVLDTVTLPT